MQFGTVSLGTRRLQCGEMRVVFKLYLMALCACMRVVQLWPERARFMVQLC